MATMSGKAQQDPFTVEARGTFILPEGMTQEEADRLAREADEKRRREDN